jgi:hypothetical protein
LPPNTITYKIDTNVGFTQESIRNIIKQHVNILPEIPRAIFLDVDGVLNYSESESNLETNKVKLIQKIIQNTDAKIIISSSWRLNAYQLFLLASIFA